MIGACKESQKYGYLGIVVPNGDMRVSEKRPYLVTGVYEDSAAYKAGIRPDDIIIQINGVDLKGMKQRRVHQQFLLGKPGSKVTLTIKRKDKETKMTKINIYVVTRAHSKPVQIND